MSDMPFITTARLLVPYIQATADKLIALAKINSTVHTPTYNLLIAEAAQ